MNTETDSQLMRIHVQTLYGCDKDMRLRYVREPWGDPHTAPRFFMGRTRQGSSWCFRFDLPSPLMQELEILCQSEANLDIDQQPSTASKIRTALHRHSPIVKEETGPAYVISDDYSSTNAVLVTGENVHVLTTGFPWMRDYILDGNDIGPVTASVVNQSAVSLCYCARLSSAAAEAGVDTLETARRKGYATKAVSKWAIAVRRRGLLPLYSTSWENVASQGIAKKLGMLRYGVDWVIE